ncbi:MAG: hypothetical protein JNN01_19510 [Opitutaceae bacterium]|nr:hypothetical protein [Opitutaceae bacterium]
MRIIAFLLGVFFCAGLSGAPTERGPRRERADFGVVFNTDADTAFIVPDRARSEALLSASILSLAGTPVKTLAFCVGMGGDLLYYPTKVASPVGWRQAPDEKPGSFMAMRMENARVCLQQGSDAVRTAGEAAKRAGLRFIPSLRMNDSHFMVEPDSHSMTSEFWFKHRDKLTIRESPLPFQKAYGNLLDFTHAEVRQLRLDTVFEVLDRNRDLVDGFELDFNRFQVFFPKGRAAEGAPLMTELVRAVRTRLDQLALEQKRTLHLFVRVPPSLADCTFAGLEVARWIEEGLVDLVSPSQIMTLAGDMPIGDLVALGKQHGVLIYPSLYPRTSWRLPFPSAQGASRYHGATVGRGATLEEIRAAAAGYYATGADGMYLFNFGIVYGGTPDPAQNVFTVSHAVGRREFLQGQAKVYGVTKSYYNDGPGSYAYAKQLPAPLKADSPLRLVLPLAERPSQSPFSVLACELRLGFRGLPAPEGLEVRAQGRGIFSGGDKGATWVSTAAVTGSRPRAGDAAEAYLHIPLARESAPEGESIEIEVRLAPSSQRVTITDCELRYDFENDYHRIWHRQ